MNTDWPVGIRGLIRPGARGRGAGAATIRALLAHAADLGFERVRLDTAPELLAAQALYRRFGFVAIPPYRPGLLPDALCFERPVVRAEPIQRGTRGGSRTRLQLPQRGDADLDPPETA